jgi:hypothetical protein
LAEYLLGIIRRPCAIIMSEIRKTKAMWIRVAYFALWNGLVFTVFSVLWVKQYYHWAETPYSDAIARVVVPWGWLACFFIASFFTLRGRMFRSVLISIASAVAFASVLYLFIQVISTLWPVFHTVS